jgi:hypothetical protein
MKQPEVHVPPALQIKPEPHAVPAGPLGWLQLPAPSQLSLVHGLPSSVHDAPLALLVTLQPPLPSQVELLWQLVGEQVYAVPPHVPLVQTSFFVHALPSLHVVPLVALDQLVVEAPGLQTWQGLPGLAVPLAYSVPPM